MCTKISENAREIRWGFRLHLRPRGIKMVNLTCILAQRRFHGLMRPMILKSSVRTSREKSQQVVCLSEMTNVMRCWKTANFDDTLCSKEIGSFLKCLQAVNKEEVTSHGRSNRYDSDVVNERMKLFDSPR